MRLSINLESTRSNAGIFLAYHKNLTIKRYIINEVNQCLIIHINNFIVKEAMN